MLRQALQREERADRMRRVKRLYQVHFAGMVLLACAGAGFAQTPVVRAVRPTGDAWEQKLEKQISPEKISKFHKMLTRQPHIAGTAAGRAVAEQIAEKLKSFGMTVEKHEYRAYLSHPVRLRVTILGTTKLGATKHNLPVYERSDPRDPDTANETLTPGFVAYSASGKVSGPIVYAGYGSPADYDGLKSVGTEVKDAIVLVRYGRMHRAVKVFTAEQRGAKGVLIYSDPGDDGFAAGDVWPEGMWREKWMLQRGNAKYSWFWHGDPLTPLVAATENAERLKPEDAPTLPKIPVAAISWSAAAELLKELKGQPGFQGALPFTYHVGPGPVKVEMDLQMDNGLKPIVDVIGKIEGNEEADRWVMLGGHHDAWTFGGVDPGSSGAALLETARVLSEMKKQGWKPRRSIVFAFWDAEEYGLIGSTEYAEEFAKELRAQVVTYINSDLYMAGALKAGGSASLRDFVTDVTKAVAKPGSEESVYDAWRLAEWVKLSPAEKRRRRDYFEVELETLGSGADFVPFQTFLGLPTLSLEFSPTGAYGSYGAYHSNYDTRRFMEKFGDHEWKYGRALAELLGRTAMRLGGMKIVPLHFSHAGETLDTYIQFLTASNADSDGKPYIADMGMGAFRAKVSNITYAALDLELYVGHLDRGEKDDPKWADVTEATVREVNDHILNAEKAFADDATQEDATAPRWYRHVVYGWNIYALYAGQTLPGMHKAMTARDAAGFAKERDRLAQAMDRATEELKAARRLLGP